MVAPEAIRCVSFVLTNGFAQQVESVLIIQASQIFQRTQRRHATFDVAEDPRGSCCLLRHVPRFDVGVQQRRSCELLQRSGDYERCHRQAIAPPRPSSVAGLYSSLVVPAKRHKIRDSIRERISRTCDSSRGVKLEVVC